MDWILANKAVLIGLHLGAAIIGIDAFLWVLGELMAGDVHLGRARFAGLLGVLGFLGSWLLGGYYYLHYYGTLVKPEILKGTAPWAHAIAMEAKEHIFLFIVPMAVVVLLFLMVDRATLATYHIKNSLRALVGVIVALALAIGAMGYIISAAARWATI